MAVEYPRVTEILKTYTNYEHVPKNILKRAAEKGSSVHALCAAIAKGGWIPESMIDEQLAGYVKSFQKWQEAQVKEFLIVEKRYTNTELGYSGQVDMVIKAKDDQIYLVDLKTSSKAQKTYPVQMAAYDLLLHEQGINTHGAMLVYLDKEGDFPDIDLIENLNNELWVFMSALDCWYYFNKGKLHDSTIKYLYEDQSNNERAGLHCEGQPQGE